ncbi:hypothetical protein LSAT2_028040 [Lamellibrachia satsuma]|nr:hypothetical protein LSAT2_028040 [Lamellibrachia satsuma]
MAASLKAKPAQRSEKMEELLLSEVIIMTGGFDRLGHLLLTVPSETYKKLCSCYKARHMAVIIQYYLQLFAKDLRGNFAYFVNMSSWKREHVTMLLETLNMVEHDASVLGQLLTGQLLTGQLLTGQLLTRQLLTKEMKKQTIAHPYEN